MASTQRSNIEVFFRVLGVEQSRRAFKELGIAGIEAGRKLSGIGTTIGSALISAGRHAYDLSKVLGVLGAAGLGGLAKGIKDTTDSSAELSSIVLALRAINNEVDKASGQPLFVPSADGGVKDANSGSARKTADDLAFVTKVADAAGKSVKDLASQYVQLNASATKVGVPLGDVRDLFTGMSNAATVLGVSADDTGRAFVALTQIASKGVVASEELRGQLAEALPGAIPLAAQAYGTSVKQFMNAVGQGQVDSATFIRKFGKALNDEYAGAAEKASKTTRVALGRLANAFFIAKVSIGSGELDQTFRRIIEAATQLLKTLTSNGAFTRFGHNLAEAIRPVADRFESAVNGGFDFERVLDFIARASKALVATFLDLVTASGKIISGLGNLKRVFDSYGLAVPRLGSVLVGLADAFLRITQAIATRQFTGNGFLDFFVALFALVEACVFAIGRLVAPKVGPGVNSLERAFESIAHWLNQAAAAVTTLSTGKVSPLLDGTGEGILVNLIAAVDKVRELITLIKAAWALLSGKDAPKGADLGTQKMFASRDALGDLVSGKKNAARFNEQGQQLYDPSQFDTLFKLRDIVTKLVDFIWANRGAFGAVFDGASDAVRLVTDALDKLSDVIDPIVKALGFDNLTVAIGYAAGFLFVFRRVAGVIAIARKGILAIVGGLDSMAVALSLSMPQFLVILAILAGVAFIVGKISSNWRLMKDEIGNIITLIGAGLTAGLAKMIHGLAGLLSIVPVVGKRLAASVDGFADKLDQGVAAARSNVYYTSVDRTSQRQVENGGKDPYSDAGPNGFGAFHFLADSGFAKMFDDFGSKQDETNATLKQIADQSKASNDSAGIDADLRAAAEDAAKRAGADPSYSKPVVIYLSDGSQVELRGREEDAAKFESLAAKTARNRAAQAPAWGS